MSMSRRVEVVTEKQNILKKIKRALAPPISDKSQSVFVQSLNF